MTQLGLDRPESGVAQRAEKAPIAIDDGLFSYYLGRGIANARLKSPAAKADLEQSAKLLPTAVAYNELGRIAAANRAGGGLCVELSLPVTRA